MFFKYHGRSCHDLTALNERDTVKILFSQNPGIIIQVKDVNEISEILLERGISYLAIGHPVTGRTLKSPAMKNPILSTSTA